MKFKLALLMIPALCLSGCSFFEDPKETATTSDMTKYVAGENWEVLCEHDNGYALQYYRDKDTDLVYMYLRPRSEAGGTFQPYLDSDGSVMKYENFKRVHMKVYHRS